jgi:hypothetical protein
VGTNDIKSGQPLVGSYPNELKMDPLAFSSISANQAFAVSSLTYTNGDTAVGTTPTGFPVTITLNFTDPAGLSQPFSFTYNLDVTPNNASPLSNPLNDDILTVPVAFAPETFVDSDNGQTYTLQLLGFSSDGGATITSQFTLPEEMMTQSTLYAQITAPPAPSGVPLPSSASLGFVLLGILGAWGAWRVVRAPQKA